MRTLLLAGVAGLSLGLAAAPALAQGPIQLGGNNSFLSGTNQTIVQNQPVSLHSGAYFGFGPETVQASYNGAAFSGGSQNISATQTFNQHGHTFAVGTQAVQVGANLALGSDENQSVTQTQTVNEHGLNIGTQATQVGVNVAVGSSGTQSITQTQSVTTH